MTLKQVHLVTNQNCPENPKQSRKQGMKATAQPTTPFVSPPRHTEHRGGFFSLPPVSQQVIEKFTAVLSFKAIQPSNHHYHNGGKMNNKTPACVKCPSQSKDLKLGREQLPAGADFPSHFRNQPGLRVRQEGHTSPCPICLLHSKQPLVCQDAHAHPCPPPPALEPPHMRGQWHML